jgi:hypothetical protein
MMRVIGRARSTADIAVQNPVEETGAHFWPRPPEEVKRNENQRVEGDQTNHQGTEQMHGYFSWEINSQLPGTNTLSGPRFHF